MSVCSPTRYALLTGRYCWRTSLRRGVLSVVAPLHIETNRLTMASLLQRHGYPRLPDFRLPNRP